MPRTVCRTAKADARTPSSQGCSPIAPNALSRGKPLYSRTGNFSLFSLRTGCFPVQFTDIVLPKPDFRKAAAAGNCGWRPSSDPKSRWGDIFPCSIYGQKMDPRVLYGHRKRGKSADFVSKSVRKLNREKSRAMRHPSGPRRDDWRAAGGLASRSRSGSDPVAPVVRRPGREGPRFAAGVLYGQLPVQGNTP